MEKKTINAPKVSHKLYSMMEVYENYYRCDNEFSAEMCDCGVASIMSAQGSSSGEALDQIYYMVVLEHIRVMDYGKWLHASDEVRLGEAWRERQWITHIQNKRIGIFVGLLFMHGGTST